MDSSNGGSKNTKKKKIYNFPQTKCEFAVHPASIYIAFTWYLQLFTKHLHHTQYRRMWIDYLQNHGIFIYFIKPCHLACGTLVSWLGIKPVPPAVGLLTTGRPGKSPMTFYIRDLNICGFWGHLVGGVLESIPRGYQGTTVLILSHFWLWDVCSVTTNWRIFHVTNPSLQTMETLISAQGFQELVSGPRVRKRPVRNSLGRGHLSPRAIS